MSFHAALILAILAAYFTGLAVILGAVYRADRARCRDAERMPEPEQADAETGPEKMRLAA